MGIHQQAEGKISLATNRTSSTFRFTIRVSRVLWIWQYKTQLGHKKSSVISFVYVRICRWMVFLTLFINWASQIFFSPLIYDVLILTCWCGNPLNAGANWEASSWSIAHLGFVQLSIFQTIMVKLIPAPMWGSVGLQSEYHVSVGDAIFLFLL
jgi:hypothetical protein